MGILYGLFLNVQTPLQTPIQTPLPGTVDNNMYNIPTGPSEYPSSGNDTGGNADVKGVRPGPYMVKLGFLVDSMIVSKFFPMSVSIVLVSQMPFLIYAVDSIDGHWLNPYA